MTKVSWKNIGKLTDKYKQRLDHVAQTASRDIVDVVQTPRDQGGRMPVVSGDLRESATVSVNGIPTGGGDDAARGAAIMSAGDTLRLRYESPYAKLANVGQDKRDGARFIEGAEDQWDGVVDAAARDAVRRIK